jgi:hypothetical protein
VRDVLRAFIEPTLLFRESAPGAGDFITFISRSFAEPDDTVRKIFLRFMKPMFHLLFETICEALPKHSRGVLFWRLHFSLGALFHTMHVSGNVALELLNIKTQTDAETLIDLLIPYVTAGMKAV